MFVVYFNCCPAAIVNSLKILYKAAKNKQINTFINELTYSVCVFFLTFFIEIDLSMKFFCFWKQV